MKTLIYTFFMLNFINHANSQISLKDSHWMFNTEFATIYVDGYDFVRFNNESEIEYLNGKGELIGKDTLIIDEEGNYKIKSNPFFKGIEFISSNEINLVIEQEHIENDKSLGLKESKYNLKKMHPTQIKISNEELESLSENSEWELNLPNKETTKTIKFSNWKNVSKDEKEKLLKDSRRFSKHKESSHLVVISNSIIFIRQRFDTVKSKAIVSKISQTELVMLAENKEWILKRKK